MPDAWDEFCAELSKAIWEHPRSYVATRFDRVKAEGDKMQEKLEAVKTLQTSLENDYTMATMPKVAHIIKKLNTILEAS